MDDSTPVTRDLTDKNVPHRVFRHPGPIHSFEQAARERDQQPEQVIRSIVFRVSEESFIMVLVAGPRQIYWTAIRRYLGLSRLTMASREEVLRITGYQLGAVSPFGLPQPMRVLVDQSVFTSQEISISSGERGVTVILRSEDLKKALGEVEIGNFVQEIAPS